MVRPQGHDIFHDRGFFPENQALLGLEPIASRRIAIGSAEMTSAAAATFQPGYTLA